MIDEKKLIEVIRNLVLPYTTHDGSGWHDRQIDCYNKALLDVLTTIEQHPKTGEWIPVKDGLPKIYKNVEVTYLGYEDEKLYSDGFAYLDENGNWCWEFNDSTVRCEIIAWMPLPEPYMKGEDDK